MQKGTINLQEEIFESQLLSQYAKTHARIPRKSPLHPLTPRDFPKDQFFPHSWQPCQHDPFPSLFPIPYHAPLLLLPRPLVSQTDTRGFFFTSGSNFSNRPRARGVKRQTIIRRFVGWKRGDFDGKPEVVREIFHVSRLQRFYRMILAWLAFQIQVRICIQKGCTGDMRSAYARKCVVFFLGGGREFFVICKIQDFSFLFLLFLPLFKFQNSPRENFISHPYFVIFVLFFYIEDYSVLSKI